MTQQVIGLIGELNEVERKQVETLCQQFSGEILLVDDDLDNVIDRLDSGDTLVAHDFGEIAVFEDEMGAFFQRLIDIQVAMFTVRPVDLVEVALFGQQSLVEKM